MGDGSMIENQRNFFIAIRDGAKAWKDAGKSAADAKAGVNVLKEKIRQNEKTALYIGGSFAAQVEKAWTELGGETFPK
jgi:hypothetical protein